MFVTGRATSEVHPPPGAAQKQNERPGADMSEGAGATGRKVENSQLTGAEEGHPFHRWHRSRFYDWRRIGVRSLVLPSSFIDGGRQEAATAEDVHCTTARPVHASVPCEYYEFHIDLLNLLYTTHIKKQINFTYCKVLHRLSCRLGVFWYPDCAYEPE